VGSRANGYSKYTPERVDAICRLIAEGNYSEVAAQACGITKGTFYVWRNKYPEFRERIDEARAQCESRWVSELATSDDASDRRWLLERTRPKRYGAKVAIELREEAADAILTLLHARLTESAFAEVLDALAGQGGDEVSDAAVH